MYGRIGLISHANVTTNKKLCQSELNPGCLLFNATAVKFAT